MCGSVCGKFGNKSKPDAPWTLPSCQVTVIARHPLQFWEHIKKKAAEVGDGDLLENIGPPKISAMQRVDMSISCQEPKAFPVFQAVPNSGQIDTHQDFAWEVVQDLPTKVAKFGKTHFRSRSYQGTLSHRPAVSHFHRQIILFSIK